ncbi:hypothetical protein Taro_040457 [Colocasia esculenta]|uniref:Uncharacterized protein n=1 Tax=Colocasia esculenta TaxID=4460 RepID=A0A843W912_COLES|nr:hypothetical protein [Colocasia esculenta]
MSRFLGFPHLASWAVFSGFHPTVGIFARAKQMLVCCVAPLVERCDTWLWLLSALCSLVLNSGWFCLWVLNLVEVRGGRACGEMYFSLGCLVSLGVTLGCSFPTSWRSRMLVLRRETLVSRGRSGVP